MAVVHRLHVYSTFKIYIFYVLRREIRLQTMNFGLCYHPAIFFFFPCLGQYDLWRLFPLHWNLVSLSFARCVLSVMPDFAMPCCAMSSHQQGATAFIHAPLH